MSSFEGSIVLSLTPETTDLLIIGGGINGAGIAADAAGRGLSVILCEQNDLASATSSASSKLIHGGLRYLEHYEFRLVKEALAEREVLLHNAPHLVEPMRFTLPHRRHLRPGWMIRTGLFMYDHLTKRNTLEGTKTINFKPGSPLKAEIKKGYQYSDCWVDDARLVVTNALMAKRHHARILTQTRCVEAIRIDDENVWKATLLDKTSQTKQTVYARAIVNAAGPWVSQFIKESMHLKPAKGMRLIKGSHIIVPRIHNFEGAFILQNDDQRIVFVIPYQDKFSLIGTTDKEYQGDPSHVAIDEDEIQYLIKIANAHFVHQIQPKDVVSSYSGVRPLCDDESDSPSAITRDYTLEIEDNGRGTLPLLSIFGGKITTYRKLAESALEKLEPYFESMQSKWTASSPLPGATHATRNREDIKTLVQEIHDWLPETMLNRFCRSYGLLCLKFLGKAKSLTDLGMHFGGDLYRAEVDYLIEEEWAKTADDILWRRTKLGLHLSEREQQALEAYMKPRRSETQSA
jgi:glycerol-3-phosphate dehydrogenase